MKSLRIRVVGRVFYLAMVVVLLPGAKAFATGIVGISPMQAAVGSTITLSGSGFSGATGVTLAEQVRGKSMAASFTVISDTQMSVTIPDLDVISESCYIVVTTGSDCTFTLDPSTSIVTNGETVDGSVQYCYVEAGGSVVNKGEGSCILLPIYLPGLIPALPRR